jgi:acyl carrier protein
VPHELHSESATALEGFLISASRFKQTDFGSGKSYNPESVTCQRHFGAKHVSSMKPTKEELIDIIYECLEEVNEQLPEDQRIQKSPDASLVGRAGGLDSLGFVNFIALVEEKCAYKYGIALSLTDTSLHENGALEDVGRFADSLFHQLKKTFL